MNNLTQTILNSNRHGNSNFQFFTDTVFSKIDKKPDTGKLSQTLQILKRRSLVISGIVVVVNSAVVYSVINEQPTYQGKFQILVESLNENNSLEKLNSLNSNIARPSLDYESQIQVLKSPKVLQNVIKKLPKFYSNINYNSLVKDLTVRRFGGTKIIEVSYKNHDNNKVRTVLNTISKVYLEYSFNGRQNKLIQGLNFIDKQIPDLQNRVAQLQKQMQTFRQKNNFIDPESQSTVISQQIQYLTQQRLSVNQQLATARDNYLRLQTQEGQLAVLDDARLYQELISKYQQLDIQLSQESSRFQSEHPVIQTLQERKNNLLPIIQNEAKRALTIKIAEAAIAIQKIDVDNQQLAQAEQELQRKLKQLPVLSTEYINIQRNLEIANESLHQFLIHQEKLQLEVAQIELPWELIQAPTQSELPISSNIPLRLLLGFAASSLLGVGAALILEKIDNTYQTVEMIKENIKLPLLGTLPFNQSISHIRPQNFISSRSDGRFSDMFSSLSSQTKYYDQGGFWESLQLLYGNIQLLNLDKPIRSLIISSATSGDGKSTVAFHLAQTARSMGKRVLLVDADLHCPQIHKLSRLDNLLGLSNLISSNINVEQVIRQMPECQDLFVITAGSIPPDPARLLSSDKMKEMMDYFHQNFDLVIYDVPPMLGLVDVRLLAPYTDGLMLVVRVGKTDKSLLAQVQDSFKIAPMNLLGLVINGDKAKLPGYNYYYSDYQERLHKDENKITISNF